MVGLVTKLHRCRRGLHVCRVISISKFLSLPVGSFGLIRHQLMHDWFDKWGEGRDTWALLGLFSLLDASIASESHSYGLRSAGMKIGYFFGIFRFCNQMVN